MGSADESTTGPASLMLVDPDRNPVLIDQHVDSPANFKNKTAAIKILYPASLCEA